MNIDAPRVVDSAIQPLYFEVAPSMARNVVALFAASVILVGTAQAQTVYDNGAPNAGGGNEFSGWIQAEDFTLAAPANITGIRFWAFSQGSGYAGSIVWSIRANNLGAPGSVLFSDVFSGTPTSQGILPSLTATRLQFDMPVSFSLGTGSYFLALHNGPLTAQSDRSFYWETTNNNATQRGVELMAPFTGGWMTNDQEHAFALLNTTNVVPEPSTYALMAAGLAGVGAMARRRRRV